MSHAADPFLASSVCLGVLAGQDVAEAWGPLERRLKGSSLGSRSLSYNCSFETLGPA